MRTERPDLELPEQPPPENRTPGPSGAAATVPLALVMVLVGAIVACVALGGWIGLGFAVALMIAGVFVLVRYAERLAWTRHTPERLRGGPKDTVEDLAVTEGARQPAPLDSRRARRGPRRVTGKAGSRGTRAGRPPRSS